MGVHDVERVVGEAEPVHVSLAQVHVDAGFVGPGPGALEHLGHGVDARHTPRSDPSCQVDGVPGPHPTSSSDNPGRRCGAR